MSDAARAVEVGLYYWAKHEQELYAPAKVLGIDGENITVEAYKTGERYRVLRDDLCGRILHEASLETTSADLVDCDDISEATILWNLRCRFSRDQIYTNIGSILVSINPFKWLHQLYSKKVLHAFASAANSDAVVPHVWTIARNAYNNLAESKRSQAIIISGESGAGKTEATKKCLQFLAEATHTSGEDKGIEGKILQANPILEAFGNAKTLRNNNSSRFGKWIEIQFDCRGAMPDLCGAITYHYLLEKSRVVRQSKQERNYHIFYQLCSSSTHPLIQALQLGNADDFHYLAQSGCTTITGVSDRDELSTVIAAFETLGCSKEDLIPYFAVVAGVLHLGNLEFETDQTQNVTTLQSQSTEHLALAAQYLGLNFDALLNGLTVREMIIRGEQVRVTLEPDLARDARDASAKAIYGHLFDALVGFANESMAIKNNQHSFGHVIGVLDIFGFEIFEANSFEQLCINYANEKLQQHFMQYVLKDEQEVYQSENIEYNPTQFIDNQDVLDLLEARPKGLLPLMDEELKIPKGSDDTLRRKFQQHHSANVRFHISVQMRPSEFAIQHYAGTVIYDIHGMLAKNTDMLYEHLLAIFQSSNVDLVSSISTATRASPAASKTTRRATTLASRFQQQLSDLALNLKTSNPHFIRCVKPNNSKASDYLQPPLVLEQLRYSGVLEAIQVRKSGFPVRRRHADFWRRYWCLTSDEVATLRHSNRSFTDLCRILIERLAKLDPALAELQFGLTLILYRPEQHQVLEILRHAAVLKSAIVLQSMFRMVNARRLAQRWSAVRGQLRDAVRAGTIEDLHIAIEAAVTEGFEGPDKRGAEHRLQRLIRAREITQRFQEIPAELTELSLLPPLVAEVKALMREIEDHDLQNDCPVSHATHFIESNQPRLQCMQTFDDLKRDPERTRLLELKRCHESSLDPLLDPLFAELDRIVEQLEAEEQLNAALMESMSTLNVEDIFSDAASGNVADIAAKLEQYQAHPPATSHGRLLHDVASSLDAVLKACAEPVCDWQQVTKRLHQLTLEYQQLSTFDSGDGMSIAIAAAQFIPAVLAHVGSVVEEHYLLPSLEAGLRAGSLSGTVGSVVTSPDMTLLEEAIEYAASIGCSSAVTQRTLNEARVVSQARRLYVAQDWVALDSWLSTAEISTLGSSVELSLALEEARDRRVQSALSAALQEAANSVHDISVREAIFAAVSLSQTQALSLSSQKLLATAQEIAPLLRLVESEFWIEACEKYLEFNTTEAHSDCHGVLEVLRGMIVANGASTLLAAAANEGSIQGADHALDSSAVATTNLQRVLSMFTDDAYMGEGHHAVGVVECYRVLTHVRELCSSEEPDWSLLDDALRSVRNFVGNCPVKVQHELQLVARHITYRSLWASLVEVVDTPVNVIFKDAIAWNRQVEDLLGAAESKLALGPAEELQLTGNSLDCTLNAKHCGPPELVQQLLHLLVHLQSIQDATKQRAWPLASELLARYSATELRRIAPMMADYLSRLSEVVDEEYVREVCEEAMLGGRASGEHGMMDFSTVQVDKLEHAISIYAIKGCRTNDMELLLESVTVTLDLRRALLAGDWSGVINACESASTKPLSQYCAEEIEQLHVEMKHRKLVTEIAESAAKSAVQAEVGAPKADHAALGSLRDAIESAKTLARPGSLLGLTVQLAEFLYALHQGLDGQVEEGLADVADNVSTAAAHLSQFLAKHEQLQPPLHQSEIDSAQQASQLVSMLPQNASTRGRQFREINAMIQVAQLAVARTENELVVARLMKAAGVALASDQAQEGAQGLDLTKVKLHRLAECIKAMNDVPLACQCKELNVYTRAVTVIHDLRAAVMHDQWDAVSRLLELPSVQDLPSQCAREIELVKAEAQSRWVTLKLTHAIQQGGLAGKLDTVDLSTLDTDQLHAAIEIASSLERLSPAIRSILLGAEGVLKVRQLLLPLKAKVTRTVGDEALLWKQVWELVSELLRQPQPAIVESELSLVRDLSEDKYISGTLQCALAAGAATGEPGALDLGSVIVDELEGAMRLALELRVRTEKATQLLYAARTMKTLRIALLRTRAETDIGAWKSVMAAISQMLEVGKSNPFDEGWRAVRNEITALQLHVQVQSVKQMLDALLVSCEQLPSPVHQMPEMMDSFQQALEACDALPSGSAVIADLHNCATLLHTLCQAIAKRQWVDVEVVCISTNAQNLTNQAATRIVTAALVEARIRIIEDMLQIALGFKSSSTGHARVGDNLSINQAIAAKAARGVTDQNVVTLATIADAFLKLRHSIQGDEKSKKAEMFAWFEQHKSFCSGALLAEIDALREQCSNREAVASITEVLSRFRTTPSEHPNQPSTFDTKDLQRVINACASMHTRSDEVEQLLRLAELILNLRVCLNNQDFDGARDAIESTSNLKEVHHVAIEEIAAAKMAVDGQVVVQALTIAMLTFEQPDLQPTQRNPRLRRSMAGGTGKRRYSWVNKNATDIDTATIDVKSLVDAIKLAEAYNFTNGRYKRLFETGCLIRDLRLAMIRDDWLAISKTLQSVNDDHYHPVAAKELQMLRGQLQMRTAIVDLSTQLRTGHASCLNGVLNIRQLNVEGLEQAVERATASLESGAKRNRNDEVVLLQKIESLHHTATVVLEIRKVLARSDMQLAGKLAAQALEQGIDVIAKQEISHYASEIGRTVHLLELCRKLREACGSGDIGRLRTAIKEACKQNLHKANDLGFLHLLHRATRMLQDIVTLHEQMRQALMHTSRSQIQRLLERAQKLKIPSNDIFVQRCSRVLTQLRSSGFTSEQLDAAIERVVLQYKDGMRTLANMPSILLRLLEAIRVGSVEFMLQESLDMRLRFLSQLPHRMRYSIKNFHAERSVSNKSLLASVEQQLSYSVVPVIQPFTALPAALAACAVRMHNQNLLGIGGEVEFSHPEVLVRQTICVGCRCPALRAEIFIQLTKQIHRNSSLQSRHRLRQVLHLCLRFFPPPQSLENNLELFFWEQDDIETVARIHASILRFKHTETLSTTTVPELVQLRELLETGSAFQPEFSRRRIDQFTLSHWNQQRQVRGSVANWCFRYLTVVGNVSPLSTPLAIAQRMATQHDWDAEDRAIVRYRLVGECPDNAEVLVEQLDLPEVSSKQLAELVKGAMDTLRPEDVLPKQPVLHNEADELLDFEYELRKRMLRLVERYSESGCFTVASYQALVVEGLEHLRTRLHSLE